MSDRYNGWTNYETWCVKLWIDNDQGDAEQWAAEARDALEVEAEEQEAFGGNPVTPDTVRWGAVRLLSELLREAYDEAYEGQCTTPGVFGDLLRAALSEVNWHEIAEAFIDEEVEHVADQ